jgi:hypothetical protein
MLPEFWDVIFQVGTLQSGAGGQLQLPLTAVVVMVMVSSSWFGVSGCLAGAFVERRGQLTIADLPSESWDVR